MVKRAQIPKIDQQRIKTDNLNIGRYDGRNIRIIRPYDPLKTKRRIEAIVTTIYLFVIVNVTLCFMSIESIKITSVGNFEINLSDSVNRLLAFGILFGGASGIILKECCFDK